MYQQLQKICREKVCTKKFFGQIWENPDKISFAPPKNCLLLHLWSCVFIKTCWSLSEAYCIPGKLCHFQSSGIFELQKNGRNYEITNVIFGPSAPKQIKKHQKIKIKKQDQKSLPSDYQTIPININIFFTNVNFSLEAMLLNSSRRVSCELYWEISVYIGLTSCG